MRQDGGTIGQVTAAIGAPARRRAPVLATVAGAGVAAGVLAKAADESGIAWANDLGSYPAVWVLAVALLGAAAPTWRSAALRSAVFSAAMTVAYYVWATEVLDLAWQPDLLVVWLLLSATAVPVTAVAVREATRRAGVLSGALLALAAGIDVAGGVLQRQYWLVSGARPYLVAQPVQAVADVVVAIVLVVLLPRHRATRLWALGWLVPLTWLAAQLLAVLQPYTV